MKISVITVSYNSASTIVDTVESVLGQTYESVEYLVVDGGSEDETLDRLKPYEGRIDSLVSERDNGMYDAMNKGISRATGDVIAILNSDDVYANEDVLAKVAHVFEDHETDSVYGDLHYVAHDDLARVVRNWKSGGYVRGQFKRGWHPPHPSFFVRREVYERFGGFETDLRIAADFELMLRVLDKEGCSATYLPEVLVKMRAGGESNRSIRNILRANRECYTAWRRNGYSRLTSIEAVVSKPLSKLKQLGI